MTDREKTKDAKRAARYAFALEALARLHREVVDGLCRYREAMDYAITALKPLAHEPNTLGSAPCDRCLCRTCRALGRLQAARARDRQEGGATETAPHDPP